MQERHILVVDDEAAVRRVIEKALLKSGMRVSLAATGQEAIAYIRQDRFDLIILDIMMDGTDGLEVVRVLREGADYTPIIMLSGKSEDHDKIFALGLGADDYVTKPFSPAVLCAKVEAMLRQRAYSAADKRKDIVQGRFRYVIDEMRLYKDGKDIPLSPKESIMMLYFMEHPALACTKEDIYRHVWGNEYVDDNTIMVHVRRLRAKIEDHPDTPRYLCNVRGVGYRFM